MSMISEQIKKLRDLAELCASTSDHMMAKYLNDAADTIEELSAKLQAANMERSSQYYNGGWIPVSERLPEEKVNPITHDYYEYQCTFRSGDIYDVRSYKFGKGHWWLGCGVMDEYVTAWMPLPLPYKASPTGEEVE